MTTDDKVRFLIESEEGIGTTVQIRIPKEAVRRKRHAVC